MIPFVVLGVLGLLFLALEWQRPRRERLALRLAATLVAWTALAALLAPPKFPALAARRIGVLVTPGASMAEGRRAADSIGTAEPMVLPSPGVYDPAHLARRHPELDSLLVLGAGVRDEDWAGADRFSVTAGRPPRATGFVAATWRRAALLGDQVAVEGRFVSPGAAPAQLRLEDLSGVVDSLETAAADTTFRFSLVPKAAGRHRYVVRAVGRNGATMAAESLGVAVVAAAAPSLLLLQGTPRFETRDLTRLLAGRGGRVAVRTRVAKDRYLREFFNRRVEPFERLSPELLRSVDIVVLDGLTVNELSAPEMALLRRAVLEEGLGVLVWRDSVARAVSRNTGSDQRFFLEFPLVRQPGALTRESGVALRGPAHTGASPVEVESSLFEERPDAVPILEDGSGRTLAAVLVRGRGRIGTSLVLTPSAWAYRQERDLFEAYWGRLLGAVARDTADRWSVSPDGPVTVDQSLAITLFSSAPAPVATVRTPAGAVDTVSLRREAGSTDTWSGLYWPASAGWHELRREGGGSLDFHGEPAGSWAGADRSARARGTARRASLPPGKGPAEGGVAGVPRERPMPRWWLFVVFLVAAGWLWAEGMRTRGRTIMQ
ncbi:MAG: hypothetical protein HOP28_07750 [Gemmatimonadales bacterium]|nr:hypothetical protein [Gemmatimonadales bacterium]